MARWSCHGVVTARRTVREKAADHLPAVQLSLRRHPVTRANLNPGRPGLNWGRPGRASPA